MIRYVKQIESSLPKQHPIGMTYQNRRGKNQTLLEGPADRISPYSEGGFRDDPPDLQGAKVVLSDTDHLWGVGGDAIWVWKTFTRRLNPIFMDTDDGQVLGKVRPRDDGPRQAMGQALALWRRINLARSTPRAELFSTGYCLAEPNVSYVVSAPEGGGLEVDLTAAGSSFQVEWHNVASGMIAQTDAVTGGAKRRLHPPSTGAGYTQKQIAQQTGKSEGEISKLLSLLTLAPRRSADRTRGSNRPDHEAASRCLRKAEEGGTGGNHGTDIQR